VRAADVTDRQAVSRNRLIAARLREMADLLELQGGNPFRAAAYRRAGYVVAGHPIDMALLLEREGLSGIDALPGIGPQITRAIAELARSGRWAQLERLRGEMPPERLFTSIPGIGRELARRIHDTLDIDTLEELETAAHDGRLAEVPGLGPRRVALLRAALAGLLSRIRPAPERPALEPDAALLLEIDRAYRQMADAGALPRIAPRRFNPTGEAWLPIWHTERGSWHFTAIHSNTARAHQLGRVRDWVVIYFQHDHGTEDQRTVVTETRGPLTGRRVIRGREAECADLPRA
jgi:DNA polymerase (family X)